MRLLEGREQRVERDIRRGKASLYPRHGNPRSIDRTCLYAKLEAHRESLGSFILALTLQSNNPVVPLVHTVLTAFLGLPAS